MFDLPIIARMNWERYTPPKQQPVARTVHFGLEQRDEFNAARDALSYPEIPDAREFYNATAYRYEAPTHVYGWQWSVTFGRWSALVTFADGWHGYTYPKEAVL